MAPARFASPLRRSRSSRKRGSAYRQREPTREELHALVAGYLKEELLGLEAREMGLDQNDLIIRRRLAQKVEFLVKDTSRLAEPTDDDLRRFYEANRESFRSRARVSFTHVFFNPETRRDVAADAKAALAALSTGRAGSSIGDPILLDAELRDDDSKPSPAVRRPVRERGFCR